MALDNPEVARVSAEQREPLEYRLDRERAMAEIRRILAEQTEAARLVLLAEEKSAEVARRMGVSIAEVYADTKRAMQALRLAFGVEVEAI
jgi:DNA-directed RNA polymerase specialized sigma24 family protein